MASYKVPEDVVIQILSLLPVISLMRFKCVCKSWRALIETPSFINLHSNSNKGNDNLLVINRDLLGTKYDFFFLSGEPFEVTSKVAAPPSPLLTGMNGEYLYWILAFCNGIVCLRDDVSDGVALWNPATREFRVLPQPSIPRKEVYYCFVGFGFDLKTNDYKVVRIISEEIVFKFHYNHQVELYSLSSDSWRIIDNNIPTNPGVLRILNCRNMTCVNGMYSWWSPCGDLEEMLVSFDMNNEVFVMTMLPPVACFDHAIDDGYQKEFFELNESLALIIYQEKEYMSNNWFEVWVLNEYGAQNSWSYLYRNYFSYEMWLVPLGFLNNGNLCFIDRNSEEDAENIIRLEEENTEDINLEEEDTDDINLEEDTEDINLEKEETDGMGYTARLVLYQPFSGEINKCVHVIEGVIGSLSLSVTCYKESMVSIKGGNNNINGPAA